MNIGVSRSQGYQGPLNSSLAAKLFCLVCADDAAQDPSRDRTFAAFGRLTMSEPAREPCPQGTWLLTNWNALGLRRRGGDHEEIFLRAVDSPGTPSPTTSIDVTWFMPVLNDNDAGAIWREFIAQANQARAGLGDKINGVTLRQTFGGLELPMFVTTGGHERMLMVNGMVFGPQRYAYQFARGQAAMGNPQPAAAVRGWGEAKDVCRLVFYDRHEASKDGTFVLG